MSNSTPIALILFSKNWAGKAQAGRFSAEDTPRIEAAASEHGASLIAFTADDDADLLAALPAGRFGENDRPLLTAIRQEIYKRLAALADAKAAGIVNAAPEKTAEGNKAEIKKPASKKAATMATAPDDKASEPAGDDAAKGGKAAWHRIKAGDRVLAPDFEGGQYNGWWEAKVIAFSETHITLEWQGYPEMGRFTRPRAQVYPCNPEFKLP